MRTESTGTTPPSRTSDALAQAPAPVPPAPDSAPLRARLDTAPSTALRDALGDARRVAESALLVERLRHTAAAVLAATLMLLVIAPTVQACTIGFRQLGPVRVGRADLRRPIQRTTSHRAWNIDASWTSTRPELNQTLRTRSIGTYLGTSHARQQALSIDAVSPDMYGWKYRDDDRDDTPACTMTGHTEWSAPRILVRESGSEVRIIAVSRLTPGDRTGCQLEEGDGWLACPVLTRTVQRLHRPVGARRIVMEQFREDAVASSR